MAVNSILFNTQFTLERAPHVIRLKSLKAKLIEPAITVHFENEQFEVKTLNSPHELVQVLKLRFEVFFREFSTQKVFSIFPYDIDSYDFSCDHLIVKDKFQNKVIACYRLISSHLHPKIKKFYTAGEFEISDFLSLPGNKLELGRACVHKDYRNGAVISLLWKGLISYAKKSDSRYMFGCSSINRADFETLGNLIEYLENQKSFVADYEVGVTEKYKMKFPVPSAKSSEKRSINSLMHMYLMAGAKLGREMAYDAEMDCLDMFTVMDMRKLPASFERKFS